MTFTVSLAELSIFIIAIAFLILVVSVIPTLIQLRQTGKALQELSEEGKRFLAEVKETAHRVNGQVTDLEEAVKKVRDVSLKAAGVAEVVLDAVKGPVVTLAGVIAGITYGLKHFKKGKGGENNVQ